MDYKPRRGGRGGDQARNKLDGAYERPSTTRGARGRGRGNGRGGTDENNARTVTEESKRGGGDQPRNRRPALDENSWQYKYRNEERPTYESRTVTKDEVLPELPADIKKKPSRDEFDRQMKELDHEANGLRAKIEDARLRKRMVYDGQKVEGGNDSYYELISSNIEEVKKIKNERRGKLDKVNALRER